MNLVKFLALMQLYRPLGYRVVYNRIVYAAKFWALIAS